MKLDCEVTFSNTWKGILIKQEGKSVKIIWLWKWFAKTNIMQTIKKKIGSDYIIDNAILHTQLNEPVEKPTSQNKKSDWST